MKSSASKVVSDGVTFTRSLEKMFGAVVRLLVGRISLIRLEELIRKTYVKECEIQLKSEFPEKRVKLSQLALLTGMDTRALTKLTNKKSYVQPIHENEKFLSEMTHETQIINSWVTDKRFIDTQTGEPRSLSLANGAPNLGQILSGLKSARGLTQQSIVERLERAGTIEIDRDSQQISLVSVNFFPFLSNDETAMLEVGFSTVTQLINTLASNIEHSKNDEELLFQRNCMTYNLPKEKRSTLRRELRNVLIESDKKCREVLLEYEDKREKLGQCSAGVSMFYFEPQE